MKPSQYLSLILCLLLTACTSEQQTKDATTAPAVALGQLGNGFTLSPTTQAKFDEGLLLLHNFEYEDALLAFEAATALDSTQVLTHWGEAMCHYKALWRLQNTDQGKAIVARLGDTKAARLAAIADPLEKDMWEMVEIMYGAGNFKDRNQQV